LAAYLVINGDAASSFRLAEFDPPETAGFKKADAETIVKAHAERLGELQERLYAERCSSSCKGSTQRARTVSSSV